MSFFFNKFVYDSLKGDIDLDTAVVRNLLERSTSTYDPDPDDDFVSELTGLVEISVTSYARENHASVAVTQDKTNDLIKISAATPVDFGALEAGQTVKAMITYVQVGGDDTTPANDPLAIYNDGTIPVILAANASSGATSIWIEPLIAALPDSATLDFGGGATSAGINGAHTAGVRQIDLTGGALGANATAGAKSDATIDNTFPSALGGGSFQVNIGAAGLGRFELVHND